MKKLLLALLFAPIALFAQDDNPPDLYESVNAHVKPGMEDAFEGAVKAHNEKFHPQGGSHYARLFYNINGPWGGTYSWIMGPTSWTALDSRPADDAHDDDWAKVEAMVEKFDPPTYWDFSNKLSNSPDGVSPKKRLIWIYDLKRGKGARFSELVEQIKEVYTEKLPNEPFWVVWNEFADTNAGMDVAFIFAFDNWAWMDRDSKFWKDFEAVHGEGSWNRFLDEFRETVEGRTDFIRERID